MTRCSSSCWHLLSLSERSHPHHDGRRSPRQICVCTGHSHLGYRLWTFWSRVSETCCIRTNINLMSKVHFHWGSNDEQGSEHLVGTDAIDHQNKIRWWPRLLLEALDPGWRQGVPLRDAPRSLQGDRLRRRCSQRRKCREIERRGYWYFSCLAFIPSVTRWHLFAILFLWLAFVCHRKHKMTSKKNRCLIQNYVNYQLQIK